MIESVERLKRYMTRELRRIVAICSACDRLKEDDKGVKRCSECGCLVQLKAIGGQVIKSKCPLNKW